MLVFPITSCLFLGNNGSSVLSAIIAISLIETHQINNINFSAEIIFLLLIIPGIDMLRLFIIRIINRKNPFEGDNEHIQHFLIKKYTHLQSSLIIVSFAAILFIVSFWIQIYFLIIVYILLYIIFVLKMRDYKVK